MHRLEGESSIKTIALEISTNQDCTTLPNEGPIFETSLGDIVQGMSVMQRSFGFIASQATPLEISISSITSYIELLNYYLKN